MGNKFTTTIFYLIGQFQLFVISESAEVINVIFFFLYHKQLNEPTALQSKAGLLCAIKLPTFNLNIYNLPKIKEGNS